MGDLHNEEGEDLHRPEEKDLHRPEENDLHRPEEMYVPLDAQTEVNLDVTMETVHYVAMAVKPALPHHREVHRRKEEHALMEAGLRVQMEKHQQAVIKKEADQKEADQKEADQKEADQDVVVLKKVEQENPNVFVMIPARLYVLQKPNCFH